MRVLGRQFSGTGATDRLLNAGFRQASGASLPGESNRGREHPICRPIVKHDRVSQWIFPTRCGRPGKRAAGRKLRHERRSPRQLARMRRQVSGVSESLDGLRTSVDLSSKATTDRFGRFADNLDRIERASSSSTAKLDRLAQAAVSAPPQAPAQSMPMTSGSSGIDTTGSLLPSERASAPKKVVKGWSVRQAYEGIAILQGPNGLVEAILGQQVPGLGHIEEIRNENGRLLVLSSSGAILPARKGLP